MLGFVSFTSLAALVGLLAKAALEEMTALTLTVFLAADAGFLALCCEAAPFCEDLIVALLAGFTIGFVAFFAAVFAGFAFTDCLLWDAATG